MDPKSLLVESKDLHQPSYLDVAEVLSQGLVTNFAEVSVNVVDCPDLTKEPFTLVCPGLGGAPQLFDIGGPPYLLPLVKREKVYSVPEICKIAEIEPVYTIGAGAGPWPYLGVNCEGIINLSVVNGKVNQQSRIASITPIGAEHDRGTCKLETLPQSEIRCALLGNLFMSQGKREKVLRVICKNRIGSDDFITAIRESLQKHYGNQPVGLGGTFLLKEGKCKEHIMPDFPTRPMNSDKDVDEWLHFLEMSAPLINVGTLISQDPGLDLRVQHFHTFSHHGEGGHYHIDTTPEKVSYIGYFSIAEKVVRVDRPQETHNIGRD